MAIWTLPDMGEIFHAVALLEPARSDAALILPSRSEVQESWLAARRGLAWFRLAHVCQSWRATLLGMSDLCGRVTFTFPSLKHFSTLLERARESLVDIAAFLDDPRWP